MAASLWSLNLELEAWWHPTALVILVLFYLFFTLISCFAQCCRTMYFTWRFLGQEALLCMMTKKTWRQCHFRCHVHGAWVANAGCKERGSFQSLSVWLIRLRVRIKPKHPQGWNHYMLPSKSGCWWLSMTPRYVYCNSGVRRPIQDQ